MSKLSIGLLIALVLSLLANAYQFVVVGVGAYYAGVHAETYNRDRHELRQLALNLAQGQSGREAFYALPGRHYETEVWVHGDVLRARFDGNRLADVCWTMDTNDGPCGINNR
jgi:hypothetical protein